MTNLLDYIKAHLTDARTSHILSTFFVIGAMMAPAKDQMYLVGAAAVLAAFGYRPPKSISDKVDALVGDGAHTNSGGGPGEDPGGGRH